MAQRKLKLSGLPDWPALMSGETAAAYLDMSLSSFRGRVDDGVLPQPLQRCELGRHVLWRRADIDNWINGDNANEQEWGEVLEGSLQIRTGG